MGKKLFLAVTAAIVVVAAAPALDSGSREKPNVILITVDALRADHLGIYGYDRNTTPRIDRFAQRNTVFTDAISPSASTLPSIAGVFTSRYPYEDQIVARKLRKTRPAWQNNLSLIQELEQAGYHTHGIVSHEYLRERWGFGENFDRYNDEFLQRFVKKPPRNESLSRFMYRKKYWEGRTAEETTDLALEALQKRKEPFFLWLHYFDPHSPYMPPEKKYLKQFSTEFKGKNTTREYHIHGYRANISSRQLHRLKNRYAAEVAYTDHHIGRLFDALEKKGMMEDTLVVLTSDHGECLGSHGIIDHNYLHRCSLHVPLITHFPGRESARIQSPVSTVDILPTILSEIRISYSQPVRGENLFSGEHRRYQYAENLHTHVLFDSRKGNQTSILSEKIENRRFETIPPNGKRDLSHRILERLEKLGYKR